MIYPLRKFGFVNYDAGALLKQLNNPKLVCKY